MNAGRGIIHEEMPQQTNGLLRGFQLWVNLPSADKMSAPGYQDIPASRVTELEAVPGLKVRILAGEYQGVRGPVTTQAVKPLFLDLIAHGPATLAVPVEASHNAFLYCYEGEAQVGSHRLVTGLLAVLSKGTDIDLDFELPARLILVAGAPIGEPVVQYGPFVMNTEAEIRQAIADYQSGSLAG